VQSTIHRNTAGENNDGATKSAARRKSAEYVSVPVDHRRSARDHLQGDALHRPRSFRAQSIERRA
jgi:hypothetical protein